MTNIDAPRVPASVIWALGLTQIIGYGTLYYSFGALAPSMAAEFGWPEAWVYAALSGSLLVGGLVAPLSGRWADRLGAARLMAWGSIGAAAALVLCALAPEGISFIFGFVAIEVACAFVLYATAFAALAQVAGSNARRSITHLTLIAGFASTIFWPLTSWLHGLLTWREVYLVFAVMHLVICAPVHFRLSHATRRRPAAAAINATFTGPPLVAPSDERRTLVLMLIGFALIGFVSSAITVQMLPMLGALGMGGASVVIGTLFGPAQVLSRLVNMQFGQGLSQPALGVIAAGLEPVALVLLVLTSPWFPGAAMFAILFGLGGGLSSIVSGTLPLALFGTTGYGQRLGWISSARLVVSALAPFVFSIFVAAGSIHVALWFVVLVGLGATAAFGTIWWSYGRVGRKSEPAASQA